MCSNNLGTSLLNIDDLLLVCCGEVSVYMVLWIAAFDLPTWNVLGHSIHGIMDTITNFNVFPKHLYITYPPTEGQSNFQTS